MTQMQKNAKTQKMQKTLGAIHKQRLLKGGGRGVVKCLNLLSKKTTEGGGEGYTQAQTSF